MLRTRHTLHAALISLLHERDWDAVSVRDICERANVGRSTFYIHFADKEDLLIVGFDEMRAELRQQLASSTGESAAPLQFACGMITHAHENKRLFYALVGKHSGQVIMQRFRGLIVDLVREDLAHSLPPGPVREVAVGFLGGALVELMVWAVEARTAPPPAEIERQFLTMARAALDVLQA